METRVMNDKSTTPALKVTTPREREIRIERVFNAPRERVWRAMTDPKLVAQWWGRGNKVVIERMEVERGGHWRFVEHAPDGPPQGFEGRYREVSPIERIVQTFEWDGMPGHVIIETVILEDLGDEDEGRQRLALPHQRRTRRHAELRHGRRSQGQLRRARPRAGEHVTSFRAKRGMTGASSE